MTYLAKPKLHHPTLACNAIGFTRRDYEGKISTLCAGCGHDSISAAIIQACWELDIQPHRVAKLSGIGCSSKTPDYFLGQSHGFNTVHGRMPSVLTGANLANRELIYLGVSGDGDSASIGIGQFVHAIRRGVNMVYIVENNGVYGLTKGQFSATADQGSVSKKGVTNTDSPLDLVMMALQLGASYVGRGFSGDKGRLVPLIKGALSHRGAAFLDVISGPRNVPGMLAEHASEMYARNLLNFINPCLKDGRLEWDFDDEVYAKSVVTHAGEVRYGPAKEKLGEGEK
jgi:2-oxoglutarate/2-oxoacid ferredoxin oxidoreductase subunit beta